MIGILSLNACVDKTFYVKKLQNNAVLRSPETFVQAGGKGINVARVLKSLGAETKLFTMLAGRQGQYISDLLQKEALPYRAVFVSGESRMYLTVMAGKNDQLAVKENGPELTDTDVLKIKTDFLDFLEKETPEFLCISDTIPCRELIDFYPFAICEAKRRDIPVFFDCDGEALRLGLQAGPDYCKPNTDEYSEIYRIETMQKALLHLQKTGILHPIISRGQDGISFLDNGIFYTAVTENTNCVSPVGCGDCFIGGTVFGISCGYAFCECIRLGAAAAAANAEKATAARISRQDIENKTVCVRLIPQNSVL